MAANLQPETNTTFATVNVGARQAACTAPNIELSDRRDSLLQKAFKVHWGLCENCHEQTIRHVEKSSGGPCTRWKRQPSQFTEANNMNPGIVLNQLFKLSPFEKPLIASVHPVNTLYRVKGWQYGYRGPVLDFPQDVAGFVSRLPPTPSSLSSVLLVKRGSAERHNDFVVNRQRFLPGLKWLQLHKPAYSEITVDAEALLFLLANGNIMDSLQTILDTDEKEGPARDNGEEKNDV